MLLVGDVMENAGRECDVERAWWESGCKSKRIRSVYYRRVTRAEGERIRPKNSETLRREIHEFGDCGAARKRSGSVPSVGGPS